MEEEYAFEDDELSAFAGEDYDELGLGSIPPPNPETPKTTGKKRKSTKPKQPKPKKQKVEEEGEDCEGSSEEYIGGSKRPKGKRRKISKELEAQLSDAQSHFISGEFPEAIEILLEVVRLKPSIKLPYITLGVIHEEMGDMERALSYFMIAAHIEQDDTELWIDIARKSSDVGNTRQALYCWNKALRSDPENQNLWWEKAKLQALLGEYRKAAETLTSLLEISPGDPQVIEELATIYISKLNNSASAAEILLNAFIHYRDINELQNIDLNIINILVELYLQEGEYQKAMEVINPVVETVQQVPIEITVHLATCVAHLGTPDQAITLLHCLLEYPADDYADLYLNAGELLMKINKFQLGKKYLKAIAESSSVDHFQVLFDLATCENALLSKSNKPEKCLGKMEQYLVEILESTPEHTAACLLLCTVYKKLQEPKKALEMINNHIQAKVDDVDIRILHEKAHIHFSLGEFDQFISCSSSLLSAKHFKPRTERSRQPSYTKKETPSKKEKESAKEYEDSESLIRFSGNNKPQRQEKDTVLKEYTDLEWSNFIPESSIYTQIVEYCKVAILNKKYPDAYQALSTIISSQHNFLAAHERTLYLLHALFCIGNENYNVALTSIRTLITKFPDNTVVWKLVSYLLICSPNFFGKIQKLLSKSNTQKIQAASSVLLGHLYFCSRNFKQALVCYLNAKRLAPENNFVNLFTGIGYVSRVMSKFSYNRHEFVVVGFAFLFTYYRNRANKAEANYNMGRAFQQIGLYHHSIHYYEAVLAHPSPGQFRQLAAYNLSRIYLHSGSPMLARKLLATHISF